MNAFTVLDNFDLRHPGFTGQEASYPVVIVKSGAAAAAIISQCREAEGASVTNLYERLANVIRKKYLDEIDGASIRWFEHYPADQAVGEPASFDRVELTWNRELQGYAFPEWRYIPPESELASAIARLVNEGGDMPASTAARLLIEDARVDERTRVHRFSAPSAWASYLINGDASGLDEAERAEADAFIEWVGLAAPVDCEALGFCARSDAASAPGVSDLAGDMHAYAFLEQRLAVGDQVYWNDPDEGLSSGVYTVTWIGAREGEIQERDTVVAIKNEAGGEAEVLRSEVTRIRPGDEDALEEDGEPAYTPTPGG